VRTLLLTVLCAVMAAAAPAADTVATARGLAGGQRPEALQLLEQRLSEEPADSGARTLHGIILCWDGRYDEARWDLEAVLAHHRDYGDARRALINVEMWSDHPARAEALGEEGRMSRGSAYTLYPEIVRIPLVVRLPPDVSVRVSSDGGSPAYSTDITPSLYYLAGHRLVLRHELFGWPLFTEKPQERRSVKAARSGYLPAASYGALYGMLSGDGRDLYVANALNYRRYRFDLGAARAGAQPVSDSREQDERIRSAILAINRFDRFGETGEVHP
jgi:hypothetical protein